MSDLLLGTNFDVTTEVVENGGLNAIYVGWPDSLMEEAQAMRKHIFHGKGGSFKYIINQTELTKYVPDVTEEFIEK